MRIIRGRALWDIGGLNTLSRYRFMRFVELRLIEDYFSVSSCALQFVRAGLIGLSSRRSIVGSRLSIHIRGVRLVRLEIGGLGLQTVLVGCVL